MRGRVLMKKFYSTETARIMRVLRYITFCAISEQGIGGRVEEQEITDIKIQVFCNGRDDEEGWERNNSHFSKSLHRK